MLINFIKWLIHPHSMYLGKGGYGRKISINRRDSIKEQMFRAKAYPPLPKVINEELKKWNIFRSAALQWLFDMLLYNRIVLQDIPRDIRVSDSVIYIGALRLSSRGGYFPCERFIKDMTTLCEDICSLDDDDSVKNSLVDTFSSYLNINEHKEDEAFVNFEKNLCKEILRELRKRRKNSRKTFEQQLKNRRIK